MREKKAVSAETFICIIAVVLLFTYIGSVMGVSQMFNTLMNTAHGLLLDTVFFIMAISVITGAFSALLAEFGVIALLNRLISPLMRWLYGLPGAASLGIVTTFVSDNPAILTLTKNKKFIQYFKEYQVPALCNLGTAFGMGLILITFMIGQGGKGIVSATVCGFLGAVAGSIISVRLMLHQTSRYYHVDRAQLKEDRSVKGKTHDEPRQVYGKGVERIFNALLEGGQSGVSMGLGIIPGVLVICTLVMLLTFGPGTDATGAAAYTGAAYEGVALLPKLGQLISPVTRFLFGFQDPSNIAFPITSMGATGAAMALVPPMLKSGAAGLNEVAVFTAIGMCWSGYLSTHVSMMDALDKRVFIKAAIFSHTIGGLCAGVAAHYLYVLWNLAAGLLG